MKFERIISDSEVIADGLFTLPATIKSLALQAQSFKPSHFSRCKATEHFLHTLFNILSNRSKLSRKTFLLKYFITHYIIC